MKHFYGFKGPNQDIRLPYICIIKLKQDNCRLEIMNGKELTTEQMILEAAEAEFLKKGYGNTKTVAIAKKAGVSHSMLHYYFRTKENLFQKIFVEKVQVISSYFESIFDQRLPFFETVRLIVKSQFDFATQNPNLPHFMLNEILLNKDNRTLLLEALSPKVKSIAAKLDKMLADEISKGTIRPIGMYDFIMNIVSINVSTFIMLPIIKEISPDKSKKYINNMLNERMNSNVQFVLNGLNPHFFCP